MPSNTAIGQSPPIQLALAGMLTLAVAVGIGRFAFTPILPMMQADAGLSLQSAGWLAAANYVGYFLGALSAIWMRISATLIVRFALVAITLLTATMGITHDLFFWLVLRGLAGIASAWALIFASAWTLQLLAARGKEKLSGIVFAGVGLGTMVAGGFCLVFLRFATGLAGSDTVSPRSSDTTLSFGCVLRRGFLAGFSSLCLAGLAAIFP
jgi:MFS family permease